MAFLVFGAIGGTVIPRLPGLKEQAHLTDGQVGLVLLGFAVGAVTGAAMARIVIGGGARAWVRGGTVAVCVALVGPALAQSLLALLGTFFVIGILTGFLDVLENAQAAAIEREERRPMINGFHGFWSLGAIAGSIGAAAAAHVGMPPLVHFGLVGMVLAIASIPLLAAVPDTRGGAATVLPAGVTIWHIGAAVGAVGAIAFLGILIESGGADWSAIYLREFGHEDPGVAAIGYAGFATAMTVVRFSADRLTARVGPGALLMLGGLVAVGGFALAIGEPSPALSISGFALVGAGAAVIVPLASSAAANLGTTGTTLSVVMSSGYTGSIVGPFLVGQTADRIGLRWALSIPLLASAAVVLVAFRLRRLAEFGAPRLADVDLDQPDAVL